MNDSAFTPALWCFGLVLGVALAGGEVLILARRFDLKAALLIGLVNAVLLYLLIAARDSYLLLFFFPIPIIPLIYVLVKGFSYLAVQRITGVPAFRFAWLIAVITLFVHTTIGMVAYSQFTRINPAFSNLEQAIRDKNDSLLKAMLWLSFKSEPNMTRLVNEAIEDHNDAAVERLISGGADPHSGDYRLRAATPETQWRFTRWMLDSGVKPEQFYQFGQWVPFAEIAVSYGTAELEYCLQKGFDPARYPGAIHAAIRGQAPAMKEKLMRLLSAGADVNGVDESGVKPIFTLLNQDLDLLPVLTLLIEKGTDVRSPCTKPLYLKNEPVPITGVTPLMLAVINNQLPYVELLLKNGADKTAHDSRGFTVLEYAKKNPAALRLLR